jgi:hypothetical protein
MAGLVTSPWIYILRVKEVAASLKQLRCMGNKKCKLLYFFLEGPREKPRIQVEKCLFIIGLYYIKKKIIGLGLALFSFFINKIK